MSRLVDGRSYHFDDAIEDGYCGTCGDSLEFAAEPNEDLVALVQAVCCRIRYVLKPTMVVCEHWEIEE